MEVGIGTTLRQIHDHCKKLNLDVPFYTEADLDKSMWRIIKEQSLTMANIQPYIMMTESPLFNQETLCSGSLETFGSDNYDIKGILIAENDNLTPINKLQLKFPKFEESVMNIVELPSDMTGWTAAGYYNILRNFNKTWRDDIQIDISKTDKNGTFYHVLKASSSSHDKIELLMKDLQKMNSQVSHELGYDIKCTTEVTKIHKAETYTELSDYPGSNQLFFTGRKAYMFHMMQSLHSYIANEFSWLKEANFKLDYVAYAHLEAQQS